MRCVHAKTLSRHWGWICTILLCLVTFFLAFEVSPLELWAPLDSEGDVRQACRLIKSFMEEGTYYRVPHLGAPFIAEHYGFPETLLIDLPLVWLLSKFTSNVYFVYNMIYLATFPAAGLASYLVLRRLGSAELPAVTLSWVYACLPNHLERYHHYGISMYFTAPLVIWLALRCQRDGQLSARELAWTPLCGMCAPYPAIFSCLVLLSGGFLGCFSQRCLRPLRPALIGCSLISLTFLLALTPALLHNYNRPAEALLPTRSPSDLTQWALGLDRMMLPAHARSGHPLAPIARRYYQNFPPPGESSEAPYIGLVTLIAGAGLMLSLWRPHADMPHLRRLAGTIFLLGTAGGLGQVFTLVVGTTIRNYNRISFYLVFACLAALAIHLSQHPWTRKKQAWWWLLICLAIGEQVLSFPRLHPRNTQVGVASDQKFVAQLQALLPPQAMLWQLPYVAYPESLPAYREGEYGQGRGYAVSTQLHWSWGTLKGSAQERTQDAFSHLPLPRQLEILQQTGFAGLVVERRGYADGGRQIEGELEKLGLKKGPQSDNGALVFFPLTSTAAGRGYPGRLDQPVAEREFVLSVEGESWHDGRIDFSQQGAGRLFARSGWSEPEPDGTWSTQRRNWLQLPRLPGSPVSAQLSLQLTPYLGSNHAQEVQILQDGRLLGWWSFQKPLANTIEVGVDLPALVEIRVLHPSRPSAEGGTDTRNLGIKLHQITVSP